MNKQEAAQELLEKMLNDMGKLRYVCRTQYKLDLNDLTDRQIVEIVDLACELYLKQKIIKGVEPLEFKFIWQDNPEA